MRLFEARRAPRRSLWSHFPLFLIAAMGVVMAVNAMLMIDAFRTFPGAAPNDGFDMSNAYDGVFRAAAAQRALGWTVQADVADGAHPSLKLTDARGAPIVGAVVKANAERPLGEPMSREFALADQGGGRYIAAGSLPALGQWDLMLRVDAEGHEMRVTRRVLAR
jgi:nitrogen fixation protein FixH